MRERVLLNFLPIHTTCYPTLFCFTTDQIVVSQLAVNKSFDFLIGDTFLVSLSDASGVTQDEVQWFIFPFNEHAMLQVLVETTDFKHRLRQLMAANK